MRIVIEYQVADVRGVFSQEVLNVFLETNALPCGQNYVNWIEWILEVICLDIYSDSTTIKLNNGDIGLKKIIPRMRDVNSHNINYKISWI